MLNLEKQVLRELTILEVTSVAGATVGTGCYPTDTTITTTDTITTIMCATTIDPMTTLTTPGTTLTS